MHDDAVAHVRSRRRPPLRESIRTSMRAAWILVAPVLMLGAAGHAPKQVMTVVARDFALEMPASVPAGTTMIRLLNRGKQQHHMSIVRLAEGHTAAEGLKALIDAGQGPRPAWLHPVGGPQAAMPGTEGNALLVLEPGNYLAFCEVPGPDPAPHFMKGMAKGFTVTGSTPASTPALKGDVTLSLTEYDFNFAKPLTKGIHTVAVTNNGSQPHMVVITRLPKGQDGKPWLDWAMDPKGKQAPGQTKGGMAELSPGMTGLFTDNFTPGHYLMICFTADAKDGKPHFMHGMQKEFDVK